MYRIAPKSVLYALTAVLLGGSSAVAETSVIDKLLIKQSFKTDLAEVAEPNSYPNKRPAHLQFEPHSVTIASSPVAPSAPPSTAEGVDIRFNSINPQYAPTSTAPSMRPDYPDFLAKDPPFPAAPTLPQASSTSAIKTDPLLQLLVTSSYFKAAPTAPTVQPEKSTGCLGAVVCGQGLGQILRSGAESHSTVIGSSSPTSPLAGELPHSPVLSFSIGGPLSDPSIDHPPVTGTVIRGIYPTSPSAGETSHSYVPHLSITGLQSNEIFPSTLTPAIGSSPSATNGSSLTRFTGTKSDNLPPFKPPVLRNLNSSPMHDPQSTLTPVFGSKPPFVSLPTPSSTSAPASAVSLRERPRNEDKCKGVVQPDVPWLDVINQEGEMLGCGPLPTLHSATLHGDADAWAIPGK